MLLRTFAISLTVFAAAVATTAGRRPAAAPVTLLLGVDRPGASIAKTMVGVFYEDINFAADGGLYPERVKNRSFEFPDPLMGWKRATPAPGTFTVRTDAPVSPKNPHYLRIEGTDPRAAVRSHERRFPGRRHRGGKVVRVLGRRAPGRERSERAARGGRRRTANGLRNRTRGGDWARVGTPLGDARTDPDAGVRPSRRVPRRPGRDGRGRRLAVPVRNVQEPARRAAEGPRRHARGPPSRLPPLPRRVHRRRAVPASTATSGRRRSAIPPIARSSSTAGTTSSRTSRRRTITSRSGSASSSTSSSPRTSAPNRCRS